MNTPDPITRLNAALEGRYCIERELGEGGMATVYLADDLKHERKVALKVLKPELAAVVGAERFLAEIKTTANLQHPHILALFDSGEADSLLFYVMPYVEGESLREKLDREHQLPVEEAVRITTNVAKALDYAHKQGVIHRDVKPSNILVARGEPLLADFGIAVRRHGDQGQRLTLTGPAPGTPAYMSPEQLDGEGLADERSDVYSLACVLFEMLCGTPPHASSGVWAMIARRLTGPVPSVRERFPLAPRQVEDALRSALERDLALRTSSAAAFAASLTMREAAGDREPPQRESPRRADETQPPEHSVAVLPFANVGSGETDDFLSEGISEELRNALAGVRGLRVISRTSSVAFRDQGLSVTELATKLRVASVVEGSVRRIDDLVRVAVRLVDAGLDSNRWSETYEVRLNEVFGVQGQIAEQVARVLGARMRPVTHKSREPLPEAHALYLQARHIGDQITHDRLQRAIDLYKQALELDPEYAAAWDGLALRYTNLANISVSPDESWQLARAAAKKALSLDPDYALAHGHLGWVAMCYDGDLGQSAYHYQRALALDPHDSDIVGGAGMLARTLGHLDASNRLKQEVVSRDPVKPIGHSNLGIGCFYAGRWSDAERHLRMALTLSPAYVGAHFMLGLTQLRRGDLEEAMGEVLAEEFEPFRLIGLTLVHSALGADAEAQSALTELIQRHAGGWSYNIAYIHAFMGDPDAAFEWLERARELRDPGLTDILVQPFLENLHRDRRWPMFLESLGWSPRQLADIRFDPLGAIEAARGSTDPSPHGVLTSSVAGG